ncbi:MAG: UDP-N-acetylmuramoyl-L-alanine--D-glutamate ligase [Lachnospiraceae bacterium]
MEFSGKKVLVFGTGISGIGAADLLTAKGANVILYDGNDNADKEKILSKLKVPEKTALVLEELSDSLMDTLDMVVLSPGVPTDLPVVLKMKEKKIPIIGEVELAYQTGAGTVYAITGTNGKTTTTALLGKIMDEYYPEVYVVGNIGTPYTSVSTQMTKNAVTVAEISSFQLETIRAFHPHVSAILNITEDHLNRHHTMEEYIRVKELITENQTMQDVVVLNYEDEVLRAFGEKIRGQVQVLYFSSQRSLSEGICLEGEEIVLRWKKEEIRILNVHEQHLLGMHNYENIMAAIAMAYCAGVPVDSIRQSVKTFQAVEHRIEYVTEIDGVAYYNDSKGTNPDAAIKGIQAMNRPTLLIGGGYDKESSYEDWIRAFDGKVRYLVLIGQTKEKIAKAARALGFTDIIMEETLEEAVTTCARLARPGDAVLLSPACASWGQFPNYEVRGKMFKEYIMRMAK